MATPRSNPKTRPHSDEHHQILPAKAAPQQAGSLKRTKRSQCAAEQKVPIVDSNLSAGMAVGEREFAAVVDLLGDALDELLSDV